MAIDIEIENKDLKNYPHFDAPLSKKEIRALVSDPKRVASNRFFPLLSYQDEWQPYRSAGTSKPPKKSRPIKYAARRDAYIFAHYRKILLEKYEEKLAKLGIADCPIAYRQVAKSPNNNVGKCNIDFAKDAFDEVKSQGNCVAIALDIKGYFDNLDHDAIKRIWLELLGTQSLPADHFAVFKNITKYSYVDQMDAYRRLGYLAFQGIDGKKIEGFTVSYSDMPKQLCSPADFRAKMCGGDPRYPSLIQKNKNSYGIPQGAPISDLIANFYLIHFDKVMFDYVSDKGGKYMRYSDDILLILPGGTSEADKARKFVCNEIQNYGNQLKIKDSKTCIVQFTRHLEELTFKHIDGPQGTNGLEYLGFCFDGKHVRIRNSTISRFYRKVSKAAKGLAVQHLTNNPNVDIVQLHESFNYSLINQRFLRVKRTNFVGDDVKTWTFWTYMKRASKAFGPEGDPILKQTSRFRKIVSSRVQRALNKAYLQKQATVSKAN